MNPSAQTPTMAGRTDRMNRPFDDADRRGEPPCDDGAWSDGLAPTGAADTRLVSQETVSVSLETTP
jgi:hypothetical protein